MEIRHILYDDTHNPWCGGGGAVRALAVNVRLAADHRITAISGRFPGSRNETIAGVRFIRVGVDTSYLLSRLSFAFQAARRVRDFTGDLLVNDFSAFSPCFPSRRCRHVTILHHLTGAHALRRYGPTGLLPWIAERRMLASARRVITPSLHTARMIHRVQPSVRIDCIPNGVADALLDQPVGAGDFLLYIGRIDVYMKGLDVLIEAFSRLTGRRVALTIAGSGKASDHRRLRRQVERSGLSARVNLLGRVSEARKNELLRDCLFFVMPSRFEGWGIAALEANAAGKAVVATNIDGLSEAVVDNHTAILVPPDNAAALSDAMQCLMQQPDRRRRLGRQGRRRARGFSWSRVAARQAAVYEAVVRGTPV
jgi:glycosyltransferase involved in cell wall biosynthesis